MRNGISTMSTRTLLLALTLLLAAAPSTAQAQEWVSYEQDPQDYRSDQWFFFEFKLGPYGPDVDDEFSGGVKPYSDIFGSGFGLMIKGELDVEFWRPFGTLAAGIEIGYFNQSANAIQDTGSSTSASSDITKRSAGETSFTMVPIAALLIYRADFVWERWSVPLIPYIKLGLNYTFWWINKGDGSTASFNGTEARGGTPGWQFNGGVSLLLDVFEPKAAKTMDAEVGINHVYLFFEFTHVGADGFGSDTALNVGDTTWQGGLAFEF